MIFYTAFTCLTPIWTFHSFLFEHVGENVLQKIYTVNVFFYVLNIFGIWFVLKNHQLTRTLYLVDDKQSKVKNQ